MRSRSTAVLREIERHGEDLRRATAGELRRCSLALRYRARSGEPLVRLLPEAYALVRETAARQIGLRHYPVQLLGGIALAGGHVAEMETGEGKTLTAALPLVLNALRGRGAHLVTANDYLARRDAEWLRPVYDALGLSVGVVESGSSRGERRLAYGCDVTYGTAREFGFDFLRDRLLERRLAEGELAEGSGESHGTLQRGRHFALVDEADSVLIDDARTPLILSAASADDPEIAAVMYHWGAEVAGRFAPGTHFLSDGDGAAVELTAAGRQLVRTLSKPAALDGLPQHRLYDCVERAIRAQRQLVRDRHYIVRDGRVVIVDESTGRPAEGRQWRDGLHQAVEAKEGLGISPATSHAARITVQELFLGYERLAGMTGTASGAAGEFRSVYGLPVVRVPTHRPSRRKVFPARVFGSREEKWAAVVEEIHEMRARGRPVLVGTRSIEPSETLSALLAQAGIEHRVLHARHLAAEAEIIAGAGEAGRVTVATNMAGRGTDIRLGEGVAEAGGLHVIVSEMHESSRIDRQLIGRGARQGDPGSFRLFLSLEDDLLQHSQARERSGRSPDRLVAAFRRAQRRLEREHARERRRLLHATRRQRELLMRMGLDPYLDAPG